MRPSEVLDAQVDLLDRLDDVRFHRVINALGEYEYGRSGGFKPKAGGVSLADKVKGILPAAHTYRVTHDMTLLVEHAASGLDDLDRFDHSLAPTGCGFVSFDRPIPIHDQRGKTMLMHYLVWGPTQVRFSSGSEALDALAGGQTHSGTMVISFNDTWRQPDEVQISLFDDMRAEALAEGKDEKYAQMLIDNYTSYAGRWATVGSSVYFDEQRLGPAVQMPSEKAQADLLADGYEPHPGTNVIRLLHALWLLTEQTVARVEPEHVERPARRRAEKRKLPPKVTVIKLRREATGSQRHEGESTVEWAHRWVVRGHWRWQAVSEHHPLAQEIEPRKFRARIWINPYVKGPEGTPLVQSEKVYSLER
jgi:hypothetical protein